MGRPRKPINQLKEYRKDRHEERTKSFSNATFKIETPDYYSESTKNEYELVASYLQENGIISSQEIVTLKSTFDIYDEMQKIHQSLRKEVVGEDKYSKLLSLYINTTRTFNYLIKQFGAVPTERSKVQELIVEKPDDRIKIQDGLE